MKKNPLFWFPAFIGIVLFIMLFIVVITSFCTSIKDVEKGNTERIFDAKKALKLAYQTRKKEDISKAQLCVDGLENDEKINYSAELTKLKYYIEEIDTVKSNLTQLQKNNTEQNLKRTRASINALKDLYVQSDKKKFEKILDEYIKKHEIRLKGKKLIALTFDDGPNPNTTPQLMNILDEKKIPVTFFVLGENAQKNPEVITEEADKGHEVATHTWSHSDLKTLTTSAQQEEILKANYFVNKLTGKNITIFRPPYGSYNDDILKATPLTAVNWTVDTKDWQYRTSGPIIQNVLNYAYDGAIILMHDIHSWTIESVPQIIDTLHQEGYEFVTVGTLLKVKHGEIKKQTAYFD